MWLAISSGKAARYILSTTDKAVSLANKCIIPSPSPTENTAAPFSISKCVKNYCENVFGMSLDQIGFIASTCEIIYLNSGNFSRFNHLILKEKYVSFRTSNIQN